MGWEGMMFRKYSKSIAAVVLCFFTWTSGGVFSIAHAAQDAVKFRQPEVNKQIDPHHGNEDGGLWCYPAPFHEYCLPDRRLKELGELLSQYLSL